MNYEVEVQGSQFGDYIVALREVNQILEQRGNTTV